MKNTTENDSASRDKHLDAMMEKAANIAEMLRRAKRELYLNFNDEAALKRAHVLFSEGISSDKVRAGTRGMLFPG
jgi:hypothetical protein